MKRSLSCLILCVLLALTTCACGQGEGAGAPEASATQPALSWQEQYDLGVRYLSEGKYEEAILAFTAAIDIDPKRSEAYVGRGDAYIGSGETEESLTAAWSDYETAVALDEECVDGYLGLADVYIRRGEYEKAREILQAGLEKTGDQSIADKLSELDSGTVTDSAGQVRRMSYFDGPGELVWYHEYTYDAGGEQSGVTSYSASGTQLGHVEIRYSEEDRRYQSYWYSDDGTIGMIVYEYDEQGEQISSEHYDPDGTLTSYTRCERGADGRTERELWYQPDGTLEWYRDSEYDAEGRPVRDSDYDSEGELMGYYTWEYDAQGRTTRYAYYDQQGELVNYRLYEYDAEGNETGSAEYAGDGTLISHTEQG